MLPFLKPKQIGSVIIARRKASGSIEPEREEGSENPTMVSAAEKMISAVHAKDAMSVAEAMRLAHEHLNPKEQSGDDAPEEN